MSTVPERTGNTSNQISLFFGQKKGAEVKVKL